MYRQVVRVDAHAAEDFKDFFVVVLDFFVVVAVVGFDGDFLWDGRLVFVRDAVYLLPLLLVWVATRRAGKDCERMAQQTSPSVNLLVYRQWLLVHHCGGCRRK